MGFGPPPFHVEYNMQYRSIRIRDWDQYIAHTDCVHVCEYCQRVIATNGYSTQIQTDAQFNEYLFNQVGLRMSHGYCLQCMIRRKEDG